MGTKTNDSLPECLATTTHHKPLIMQAQSFLASVVPFAARWNAFFYHIVK